MRPDLPRPGRRTTAVCLALVPVAAAVLARLPVSVLVAVGVVCVAVVALVVAWHAERRTVAASAGVDLSPPTGGPYERRPDYRIIDVNTGEVVATGDRPGVSWDAIIETLTRDDDLDGELAALVDEQAAPPDPREELRRALGVDQDPPS